MTNPQEFQRSTRWVFDQLAAGKLKPVIARTFRLEQIVEAHRYMESNEQIGKIVVNCGYDLAGVHKYLEPLVAAPTRWMQAKREID